MADKVAMNGDAIPITLPSAPRLIMLLLNPVHTTDTIMSSVVCPGEQKSLATGKCALFVCDGAQMFTVPVPDPVSSFAYVRQRVCTKSNNVNENLYRIVNRPLRRCLSGTMG